MGGRKAKQGPKGSSTPAAKPAAKAPAADGPGLLSALVVGVALAVVAVAIGVVKQQQQQHRQQQHSGGATPEFAEPAAADPGPYTFALHRAGLSADEPNPREVVQLTQAAFAEHQAVGSRFFDALGGGAVPDWPSAARLAREHAKGGGGDGGGRANATVGRDGATSPHPPALLVHDEHPGVPFVWPPVEVGHRVRLRVDGRAVELETLALSPKVFKVHNFLSDAESAELIRTATDENNPYHLRPSTTGHKSWTSGGEGNTNSRRTSENGFDIASETSRTVKRRAFELAKVAPYDEGMADGVQVLRYQQRQAYVPHEDYFDLTTSPDHNWDPRFGGTNRFATVFLYLSDVDAGGQTVFPDAARPPGAGAGAGDPPSRTPEQATALFDQGTWQATMVDQCFNGFSVEPKKGDALLFYSQFPDGALDEKSVHGGCPVLNGTKWAANIWIWNGCRYGVCKNV